VSYSFLNEEFLKTLGVNRWGYAEDPVPLSFSRYKNWAESPLAGELNYLKDHRKELRSNLKNYLPEFGSAIVFCFDYAATKKELEIFHRANPKNLKVAAYALGFNGEDYHHFIGRNLQLLEEKIRFELGQETLIKRALDIHPILERDLAYKSGLGFFGKNSMLIDPSSGSYFMIGTLLLSKKLALPIKEKMNDHCGDCNRCVQSCPTKAIDGVNRQIDTTKCICAFTVETFKDLTPPKGLDSKRREVFGCDVCQDVCPMNRKVLESSSPQKLSDRAKEYHDFFATNSAELLFQNLSPLSNQAYLTRTQGSSFERLGKKGMVKNVKTLLGRPDSA